MNKIVQNIINAGVDESLSDFEIKRTRIVNGVALIGGIVLSLAGLIVILFLPLSRPENLNSFTTLLQASGEEKELLSSEWNIIFPVFDFVMGFLALIAVLFNYFKKYNASILSISIVALLFATFYSVLIGIRVSYFFLLTTVIPLMFYRKPWKYILFGAINIISFTIVILYLGRFGPVFSTPDEMLIFSELLNMIPSFVLLFGFVLLFKRENSRNEASLNEKNKILSLQTDEIISQRNELEKNNIEKDKANLALLKSEMDLQKTNDTKDKLFTIIAHDLRSPFSSILGLSDLLIENGGKNFTEEDFNYIKLINKSAKETLSLLDNLLNWAKSQTGRNNYNPHIISLNSVVDESIENIEPVARAKNISIENIIQEKIELYTDPDMVKTILRNLISNAVKFTQPKGKIIVSAKLETDKIEITIIDNGIGMSYETRRDLFNISTNVTMPGTAREKGSGLGLVLCKEFINILGGKIWTESEEGKGSRFIFTLPLQIS